MRRLVHTCDRCGTEIDPRQVARVSLAVLEGPGNTDGAWIRNGDYCPSCTAVLFTAHDQALATVPDGGVVVELAR